MLRLHSGTDLEILNTYIGHFTNSAYQEGNVALAAHNRGYDTNYFSNLKNINIGDLVIYETIYKKMQYEVNSITIISENDVEVVENTEENKITLITCVENQSTKRLCVIGSLVDSEVIY